MFFPFHLTGTIGPVYNGEFLRRNEIPSECQHFLSTPFDAASAVCRLILLKQLAHGRLTRLFEAPKDLKTLWRHKASLILMGILNPHRSSSLILLAVCRQESSVGFQMECPI